MLLNRVLLILIILSSFIFASETKDSKIDSLQFDEVYVRKDFSTRNSKKVNWRPADNKEMFPKHLTFSVGIVLYIITMMNISGSANANR